MQRSPRGRRQDAATRPGERTDQWGQPGPRHQELPFGLSTEMLGFDEVFFEAATGLAKVTSEAMANMVERAAALIMVFPLLSGD